MLKKKRCDLPTCVRLLYTHTSLLQKHKNLHIHTPIYQRQLVAHARTHLHLKINKPVTPSLCALSVNSANTHSSSVSLCVYRERESVCVCARICMSDRNESRRYTTKFTTNLLTCRRFRKRGHVQEKERLCV